MAQIKFKIEISGVTPLLMNKFSDAAQITATAGTRVSGPGAKLSPKEDAASRVYIGIEGGPVIPSPNLLRCIIDAGKFFKAGRSKVTTQKSSLLAAAVSLDAMEFPIISPDDWSIDTRPIRIPATGGRILRHRPVFHNWGIKFTAELDTDIIPEKLFREIVDAAGKSIGLGDFRPDCKGPFGKFKVTLWKKPK